MALRIGSIIAQNPSNYLKEAKQFIKRLTGDENTKVTFCCFHDKEKNQSPKNFFGTFDEHVNELQALNKNGYGIFICVQETFSVARKNEDIGNVRTLFVDIDDPREISTINFHAKPSLIIESSPKKYHFYWVLNEPQKLSNEEFKALSQPLIDYYKADKGCKDLARVLRLPGFYHRKNEPFLTRIVDTCNSNYSIPEIKLDPTNKLPIDLTNEPISESANEPISESANDLISESTNEPISEPISKPRNFKSLIDYELYLRSKGATGVFLGSVLSKTIKAHIKAQDNTKIDNSTRITKILNEAYGWRNFLQAHNIIFCGDVEAIGSIAALNNNYDHDELKRTLNSIKNKDSLLPSLQHKKSENACIDYVNSVLAPKEKKEDEEKICRSIIFEELLTSWLEENDYKIEYNTMKLFPECNRQPINLNTMRHEFMRDQNMDCSQEYFDSKILYLAEKSSYHPVRDYLDGLALAEDTDEYINSIIEVLYDCIHLDKSRVLERTMVRKWLIGCIARIYHPGCKFDDALVLFSNEQGWRKTSFFDALFGKFFQTCGAHKKEEDEILALMQAWVSEHGEIESTFDRKGIEQLKAFMSKRIDIFRKPYDRAPSRVLRQFALCGTTNNERFLRDSTGNRRYWVIGIVGKIDIKTLEKHRHQILAVAKHFYFQGITGINDEGESTYVDNLWWLNDEEHALQSEHNKNFEAQDPLESEVLSLMKSAEYLSIEKILDRLGITNPKKSDSNRIGDILTKIGAKQKQITVDSNRARYYRLNAFWDPNNADEQATKLTTVKPAIEPTVKPTIEPTVKPTIEPTEDYVIVPTDESTVEPSTESTVKPTAEPDLDYEDSEQLTLVLTAYYHHEPEEFKQLCQRISDRSSIGTKQLLKASLLSEGISIELNAF